jgi:hypothetical protein
MANVTNYNDGKQDGAVSPPDSAPFRIPGKTQNYNVKLESNVQDGNIKASGISLQKEVTSKSGKEYKAYAVSYDGGKTWTDGGKPPKPVTTSSGLSKDELKALQPGGALNKAAVDAATKVAQKAQASPKQVEQIKKGNDATTPAPGDANQSKPSIDISKNLRDIQAGTNEGLSAGQNLQYPKNMNTQQDCIRFKMLEYSPRALSGTDITGQENPLTLGQRSTDRKFLGTVTLPIQSGIIDGNSVTWGDDRMDAISLFKVNIMKSAIHGGFTEASQTLEKTAESTGNNFSSAKGSIANAIAQKALGVNVLARAEGAIANENVELLFQGPSLRTFNYTFKLSARFDQEAKEIANIIRFFKQGMAVQRTKTDYFLKSPNTFNIEYLHNGKKHQGINEIKECALQNISVNYTPDGYYAAHADGYLVTYDITMQFQELEPVYNDEYAQFANTNSIGY